MRKVAKLQTFNQIKILSDPRRMDILRLLMAAPATLTHLARALKKSPAWVRHHILALEVTGLVEIGEIRKTGKVQEKFYHAKANAFLLQEIILPKSKNPVVIFSGSHDIALENVVVHLSKHVNLLSMPVGSLDGLVNLRQGLCQVSGSHLLDDSGEYNTPFVKHLFPDRNVEIVTLAYRTLGLILARGNPKGIKTIADIAGPNIRFVNRNAGSGTRLWLDAELRKQRIPTEKIIGYENQVKTHNDAAKLVIQNKVDVSLGLQAAAHKNGLDFIPLIEERYDLILPREQESLLTPLLGYIQTLEFRNKLQALTGYNTRHSGERIALRDFPGSQQRTRQRVSPLL